MEDLLAALASVFDDARQHDLTHLIAVTDYFTPFHRPHGRPVLEKLVAAGPAPGTVRSSG